MGRKKSLCEDPDWKRAKHAEEPERGAMWPKAGSWSKSAELDLGRAVETTAQ